MKIDAQNFKKNRRFINRTNTNPNLVRQQTLKVVHLKNHAKERNKILAPNKEKPTVAKSLKLKGSKTDKTPNQAGNDEGWSVSQ